MSEQEIKKSESTTLKELTLDDVLDFVKDLVVIIITVLVIRTFIFMPVGVDGKSMTNTLQDSDYIFVDRISYADLPVIWSIDDPDRGDIIVFKPNVSEKREFFVKRIIGLPGETVRISSGKVYIKENGKDTFTELKEDYLNEINKDNTYISSDQSKDKDYVIPENSYFVMGDNRTGSTDSRACFRTCAGENPHAPYIVKNDIVGKVFFRLLPLNNISTF